MIRHAMPLIACVLGPIPASAQTLYQAPEGCEPIATLRLPGCLVRQVAACPNGNIVDGFKDGRFTGRAFYSHPSLFLRFEGANGYISGHEYGPGTPDRGARLYPGSSYTYRRDVYRNEGEPEPGDTGTETLDVGSELSATIGGTSYRVLDLKFTVTAENYTYRERALMLKEPEVTIGVLGEVLDGEGAVVSEFNSIPETISLRGDLGFRSHDPAPSCLPSS